MSTNRKHMCGKCHCFTGAIPKTKLGVGLRARISRHSFGMGTCHAHHDETQRTHSCAGGVERARPSILPGPISHGPASWGNSTPLCSWRDTALEAIEAEVSDKKRRYCTRPVHSKVHSALRHVPTSHLSSSTFCYIVSLSRASVDGGQGK